MIQLHSAANTCGKGICKDDAPHRFRDARSSRRTRTDSLELETSDVQKIDLQGSNRHADEVRVPSKWQRSGAS